MPRIIDITISPRLANSAEDIKEACAEAAFVPVENITHFNIQKRSIDARSRNIKMNLRVEVFVNEEPPSAKKEKINYPNVAKAKQVIVVGAGPAGLFAALKLIKRGIKPIVVEQGKDVKARRRDLAAITKEHLVNPYSNYCFGEGGAGTYSDGKLYTRSTKRGDVQSVLQTLVDHGASKDILIDAHPHIGTNKLPKIITNIRETILGAGGEVHFNQCVTDFIIKENCIKGVKCSNIETNEQKEFLADAVILATGHSARGIYELLHRKNILLEAKPFAMGVRVEHPQEFIDQMQYHCKGKQLEELRQYLPAASYSLVHQVNGRGVYSFCMCPGGIIAPCATAPGEVVTNGWSPSKRNNPYANSGVVVGIELEDLKPFEKHGVMAGLRFQQSQEQMAYEAGGKTQKAPAQRLVDFTRGVVSKDLPNCSYTPGVVSAPLHSLLHPHIAKRLQVALKEFGKKMPGYYTNDAVVVGVESRTSSPLRIPRDKDTLQHPQIKGLYPCGEGGGYAGGIVSAAIDGERVAEVINLLN